MTVQTINLHKNEVQRVFTKQSSVFASWKEDTAQDHNTALHHDFVFWKVENFVKSQQELETIEKLCFKYFSMIQEIYI